VSLRAAPVEETFALPDGRAGSVRVGLLDSYIQPGEQTTVALELRADGEVLAALNTVLDPADEPGARRLARAAAERLAAGELEPTAEALEQLADAPG
jgi:hypothetical protein